MDVTIALTIRRCAKTRRSRAKFPNGLILRRHEHHPSRRWTMRTCCVSRLGWIPKTSSWWRWDGRRRRTKAASGGWSSGRRRATSFSSDARGVSQWERARGRRRRQRSKDDGRQGVEDDFIERHQAVGGTDIASSSSRGAGWDVEPGPLSEVRARCGAVDVTVTLHSLEAYDGCPEIDMTFEEAKC